jgi:outer membrane protein TolC
VGLDVRRDLPPAAALPGTERASARGRQELEPGISAPLWLPGQRDAQQRVVDRERSQLDADQKVERLRLAGEVREAAWALAQAMGRVRTLQSRFDGALALQADVVRRVNAGDLAPADRALAQAETLAAQAALLEARAAQAAAGVTLHRLTGSTLAGDLAEDRVRQGDLDNHPALRAAREAVATHRARLELATHSRRDNPTVSAVVRFDRDAEGAPYRNTIRFGIAVPLDTEARNAPRLAAASAALTDAEVALQRRERELQADVERARIAVAAAQAVLAAQVQRAAAAGQARDAIERAFRAGERGLPDLLRVRSQALDAELARESARDDVGLAQARLHQALGLEP